MNKKINVALDMDGVLSSFNKAVCDVFSVDYTKILEAWTPGNYNIANEIGISDAAMWEEINICQNFWEDMEAFDYTYELVDWIQSRFDTFICTAPSHHKSAFSGKFDWVCNHLPTLKHSMVITKHKYLIANQFTVLVDDSDDKINKFKAYGGETFLWNAQWNSGHRFASNEKNVENLKTFLETL